VSSETVDWEVAAQLNSASRPRILVYVTEPALSGRPAARLHSAHAALAEATFGVARGRTDPQR
jgi:hypothetical protein